MSEHKWKTIRIGQHPADVLEPAEPLTDRAVLFLHGHGERTLADNPVFTKLLGDKGLRVVCPHGGQGWWLDRICRPFDESQTPAAYVRDEVLPWIRGNWNAEPPRVALLGVSMGAQGVLHMAYPDGRSFPVVVAISPIVDFYHCLGNGFPLDDMYANAEEARQSNVTLHLNPLNWPRYQNLFCDPQDVWMEGCERLGMKLSASGIIHERDFETSGGGHTWEYFDRVAPKAIDYLARKLQRVLDELA
ncbi:MAG: alpha/beta hydrolase-fold protein [Planctomycetaceae bacterium]